jgi:hypothetical protein
MNFVIVWQHPFRLSGIEQNIHVIFLNSTLISIGFDEDNGHVIFETLIFLYDYLFYYLIN